MADPAGYASLLDWRRRVAATYAAVRDAETPVAGWEGWCAQRDELFRSHPQSPLEDEARREFRSLPIFPYDPALRIVARLRDLDGPSLSVPAGSDGTMELQPFAETQGLAGGFGAELTLFWIKGYGGGVFLPFADATSGSETYGGGRYLLDGIKGADLGQEADGRAVLDFNFAYNPSCSYSNRYVCPLAPSQNRLPAAVRGGEKRWPG